VQLDGTAWRVLRDAERTRAPDLPQFLLPAPALAIQRDAAGEDAAVSVTDPLFSGVRLLDLHPPRSDFRSDVLKGLQLEQKSISPMYFYDARGSTLFDAITELPEYYPTRTELGIMDKCMEEVAHRAGPGVSVIEFGAGSGLKTRQLLAGLQDPIAYVPVVSAGVGRSHR